MNNCNRRQSFKNTILEKNSECCGNIEENAMNTTQEALEEGFVKELVINSSLKSYRIFDRLRRRNECSRQRESAWKVIGAL